MTSLIRDIEDRIAAIVMVISLMAVPITVVSLLIDFLGG